MNDPASYQVTQPAAYWSSAVPLKIGLGMSESDSPIFGANRCEIIIDDEGGGPFLGVQFINEQFTDKNSTPHMGWFNSHADIDRFCEQLHRCMTMAEEAKP